MTKNKVLILLDGSEFRRKILPYVQQFLRPEDNELVLFRVGDLPQLLHFAGEMGYVDLHPSHDQTQSAITGQVRDELLSTKDILEEAGYTVSRVVRLGNAARQVEEYLATHEIDLVAMTTRGRRGLSKALYGSIAEHIFHNITLPVMLLRSPE